MVTHDEESWKMVSKEENCGKPWNLLYSKHGWLQKRREGSGGGSPPHLANNNERDDER